MNSCRQFWGKSGNGRKEFLPDGVSDQITASQCRSPSATNKWKTQTSQSVISPIDHLGAYQPIRAPKIKVEIVRLTFMRQHAGDSSSDIRFGQFWAQYDDRIRGERGRQGPQLDAVFHRLQNHAAIISC